MSERGHGSWYFSFELPVGRDGTRQRVRRGGFRTRVAAEQARDYLLGADVDPDLSVVTVGQWLDLWLETRQSLAVSTRRLYVQHVRDYLKPYLGGIVLKDLTVGKIQAMFAALMRMPTARGKPLSAATLQRIRGVLRVALMVRSGVV
ncbi:N-terminal phage integrase SAM-like domain-containing protein [Actinocrispum wychmicini]|uniref:N-terminal phage integrase SAM-like domain-containing protein n=1 Tax=Actinocrispum wychmicini TaxID=1213861 RepID=UPI0014050097|nr:N-terminal phage integrase SAM-like domain-containing protein [Actinocrispum wychmicini]